MTDFSTHIISVHGVDHTIDHKDCEKKMSRETFYNHKCKHCLTNALCAVGYGLVDFANKPSHWFDDRGDHRGEEFNLTDMITADNLNNTIEYEAVDAISDALSFKHDDLESFLVDLFDGEEYTVDFIREMGEKLNEISIEACRIIMLPEE